MRIKNLVIIQFYFIWIVSVLSYFVFSLNETLFLYIQTCNICIYIIFVLFYKKNKKFNSWFNKPIKFNSKLYFIYYPKFWRMMYDSVDKQLDDLINELLLLEINSYIYDRYYNKISFKSDNTIDDPFENTIILTSWNANKYYSWFSNGEFKFFNEKYSWNNKRPKRTTMAKFLLKIDTYQNANI